MYRLVYELPKADGTVRRVFDADPELKLVQRRIKLAVLNKVHYPQYLFGGLKRRDASGNAAKHVGAKIKLSEDISKFYDSVRRASVYNVWRHLFHFSHELAELLTDLTTKDGALPQGAIPSSDLANLIFFRDEPSLVRHLAELGITYSRFVDDIDCSSRYPLSREEIRHIDCTIRRRVGKHGLRLKESKHRQQLSSNRMETTGLVVNRRVSLSRLRRSAIRAKVRQFEQLARVPSEHHSTIQSTADYRSVVGSIAYLSRFHPGQADGLRERLDRLVSTPPSPLSND